MERQIVNPWTWQDQLGYVHANEIRGTQRFLFCAGQAAIDADGKPVHAGDMRAQVVQALNNLEAALSATGFTLANVIRLNYYTTDVDSFFQAYDVVGSRLASAGCRCASTLLGVTRLAFPELLIEMEATAAA